MPQYDEHSVPLLKSPVTAAKPKVEKDGQNQGEDDAAAVKKELLWGLLTEANYSGFVASDAEREAFALFMAAVGDEGRAVRGAAPQRLETHLRSW